MHLLFLSFILVLFHLVVDASFGLHCGHCDGACRTVMHGVLRRWGATLGGDQPWRCAMMGLGRRHRLATRRSKPQAVFALPKSAESFRYRSSWYCI